jgi:hypothetical protein
MDMLRSGYRAMMRTIVNEPPVPVVWFRVPDDRPFYSGPTAFRSRNWTADPENEGIGEQRAEQKCHPAYVGWYNGKPPAPYPNDGEACGSAEVARFGAVRGRDPIFVTDRLGRAPCCSDEPAVVVDGVVGVGFGAQAQTIPAQIGVTSGVGFGVGGEVIPPTFAGGVGIGFGVGGEVISPTFAGGVGIGFGVEGNRPPPPPASREGIVGVGFAIAGQIVAPQLSREGIVGVGFAVAGQVVAPQLSREGIVGVGFAVEGSVQPVAPPAPVREGIVGVGFAVTSSTQSPTPLIGGMD